MQIGLGRVVAGIDGNVFIIVGGICFALCTNELVAAYGPDHHPKRAVTLACSAILALISGLAFSNTGWTLQRLERLSWSTDVRGEADRFDFLTSLVRAAWLRLAIAMGVAFLAFGCAIVLLVV